MITILKLVKTVIPFLWCAYYTDILQEKVMMAMIDEFLITVTSKSKSYPDPCGPIGPALISGFNGLEPVGDRDSMHRRRGRCVADPTV